MLWKASDVSLNSLIKHLCFHAIKRSEIAIDHNMLTANNMDKLRKISASYC